VHALDGGGARPRVVELRQLEASDGEDRPVGVPERHVDQRDRALRGRLDLRADRALRGEIALEAAVQRRGEREVGPIGRELDADQARAQIEADRIERDRALRLDRAALRGARGELHGGGPAIRPREIAHGQPDRGQPQAKRRLHGRIVEARACVLQDHLAQLGREVGRQRRRLLGRGGRRRGRGVLASGPLQRLHQIGDGEMALAVAPDGGARPLEADALRAHLRPLRVDPGQFHRVGGGKALRAVRDGDAVDRDASAHARCARPGIQREVRLGHSGEDQRQGEVGRPEPEVDAADARAQLGAGRRGPRAALDVQRAAAGQRGGRGDLRRLRARGIDAVGDHLEPVDLEAIGPAGPRVEHGGPSGHLDAPERAALRRAAARQIEHERGHRDEGGVDAPAADHDVVDARLPDERHPALGVPARVDGGADLRLVEDHRGIGRQIEIGQGRVDVAQRDAGPPL
jgi:hypothetical protein